MIIDTDKLRKDIKGFYALETKRTDAIKDSKRAIRTLKRLQQERAEDEQMIKDAEELNENMGRITEK